MALTDLTKKIFDDAAAHADEIRANGKTQVAAVRERAQEARATWRAAFEAETKSLEQAAAFRTHEQTEHEARLTLEAARRTVLDEAFAQALEQTCAADDAAYRAYITPALETLAKDAVKVTTLYTPEARLAVTEAAARAVGIAAPVVAQSDIAGGFVAESADATFDMRFEHLVQTVKRAHEPTIARTLFNN